MYDIITIGAATQDVFLTSQAWEVREDATSPTGLEQCLPLGAKLEIAAPIFACGGGAMNTAATFARLGGLKTATVCRVGKDHGAMEIERGLAQNGVDDAFLQRDAKRATAYSVILLSGAGQRTILVHRGASSALAAREIPWPRLHARWISLSSLGGDLALARRILAHAKKHGIAIAWNPGSQELAAGRAALLPLIAQTTVFNVNVEEAALLTGAPAHDARAVLAAFAVLLGAGERYAIMTAGASGAYASVGRHTWFAQARNVQPINTTGAGDAFGSGFVCGLALGWDAPHALQLGMANAEGVIMHMGAQRGILNKIPSKFSLARYRVRPLAA